MSTFKKTDLLTNHQIKPWNYADRVPTLGQPGSHLQNFPVPQLAAFSNTKTIYCHALVGPMMQRAFQLVEQVGLLDTFKSYDGCYNDRSVRGSTTISTHAFGAAFDFNAGDNPLGHRPAPLGSTGSLVPVVGVFEKCGFGWGGWWNRPDGMHFEPYKIISGADLPVLDLNSLKFKVMVGKTMLDGLNFDDHAWVWCRDFANAINQPVIWDGKQVKIGTYTYSTVPKMVNDKAYMPVAELAIGQHLVAVYDAASGAITVALP